MENTTAPTTQRQGSSLATWFPTFVILIFATIFYSSSAVGQSITVAAVGPTRLDFGPQVSTTTSRSRVIILANAGLDPMPVSQISVTGDFAATDECPRLLPAGEECRIWVSFKPAAEGVRAGRLIITDEAGTQRVVLFGTGMPVLKASQK